MAACAVLLGSGFLPAHAQTQAQLNRGRNLTRYGLTASSICKPFFGFTLTPGFEANLLQKVKDGLGPAYALAPSLFEEGMDEGLKALEAEMAALRPISNESNADAGRRVTTAMLGYAYVCSQALSDRDMKWLMPGPPKFNMQEAAAAAADNLLGRRASWQTPATVARGDLMFMAASCREQIGVERSNELYATYNPAADPRAHDYYLKSFSLGLENPDRKTDKSQCERAIAKAITESGSP